MDETREQLYARALSPRQVLSWDYFAHVCRKVEVLDALYGSNPFCAVI
jgi:hypothetical protein